MLSKFQRWRLHHIETSWSCMLKDDDGAWIDGEKAEERIAELEALLRDIRQTSEQAFQEPQPKDWCLFGSFVEDIDAIIGKDHS